MNNKLMITFDKLEPDPSLRERTRREIYRKDCQKNIRVTKLVSSVAVIIYTVLCIHINFFNMPQVDSVPEQAHRGDASSADFAIQAGNVMAQGNEKLQILMDLSEGTEGNPSEAFQYNNHYYIWAGTGDYDAVHKLLDRELADSDELESAEPGILPDMKIYSVTGYDESVLLIGIVERTDEIKQARIYVASPDDSEQMTK